MEGREHEVILAVAKAVVSYFVMRFLSGRRSVHLKRCLGRRREKVIASTLINPRGAVHAFLSVPSSVCAKVLRMNKRDALPGSTF